MGCKSCEMNVEAENFLPACPGTWIRDCKTFRLLSCLEKDVVNY